MLSKRQRYNVATMLCCNGLATTLSKIQHLDSSVFSQDEKKELAEFAKTIAPHYGKKIDGHIPVKVRSLLN